MIHPLKIGPLAINPPVLLAPMAGYTNMPFRRLCRQYGCGLVFTEVVTAEGVWRRMTPSMHYLDSCESERPIAAHIYGSNPEAMAGAAQVIASLGRFDLIDVNCGCPVRKIVGKGAGVALMRNPDRIKAIVQAITQAVSLPVTIKTRLGMSSSEFNISEVAQAAQEGGAQAIFLHARFASNRHSGQADLDTVRRIKQERSIPVIGNGGITRAEHATCMVAAAGVDGVMIGRGAIGNPWLLAEIAALWSGQPYQPPTWAERRAVILEHLDGLYQLLMLNDYWRRAPAHQMERAACCLFKGHLLNYLSGQPGARDIRRRLNGLETRASILAALDEIETYPE